MSLQFGILFVVFLTSASALLRAGEFVANFKPADGRQYAVLFVTDGSDTFDPRPTKPVNYDRNDKISGNNYVAKQISRGDGKKVHTEVTVLDDANRLLTNFKMKNPTKEPKLVLFTKNSPCCDNVRGNRCTRGCSLQIANFMQKNNNLQLYLSWGQIYSNDNMKKYNQMQPADGHFLVGLNTILSTNRVTLHSLLMRNWFQDKMAKCLIGKNTAVTLFTGTQEKQNIRKMVNKVVWELGTQSIQVITKVKNSWIVDWARWKIQLDNAMGKECTKLNAAAESCLKGIKDEVGPPLNPTDGRYSSSAKDLRGDDYHFQGIDKSKC